MTSWRSGCSSWWRRTRGSPSPCSSTPMTSPGRTSASTTSFTDADALQRRRSCVLRSRTPSEILEKSHNRSAGRLQHRQGFAWRYGSILLRRIILRLNHARNSHAAQMIQNQKKKNTHTQGRTAITRRLMLAKSHKRLDVTLCHGSDPRNELALRRCFSLGCSHV